MPPLTYIHGFETARTTAGGGGVGAWPNNVNGTKIMGGKFGRSNIFATHSLTHSLTISLRQQRESDGPGEGTARANQGDWSHDSFPEESWPCPLDSCP